MRSRFVAIVSVVGALGASLPACSDKSSEPTLSITPSGMVGKLEVSGPTAFSAVLVGSDAEVTWAVTGGGTLSNTRGRHVSFRPPPGSAMGSLTATAGELTATVQIASGPATITSKLVPGLTAPVTVQHDAQDIPHIQCATTIDCLAVQGYVQARDRWFQMDFLRHVARGKLAELIGVAGLSQDVQLRTLFTTRAGHRLEDDLAAAMDPDTKALLAGYVRGINAYLAELRSTPNAQLPAEYNQLPFRLTPADLADWTLEDTLALARLQQFQLSESIGEDSSRGQFAAVYAQGPLADPGKMEAWIRAAAPPSEQAYTLATLALHPVAAPAASPLPTIDLSRWSSVLAPAATGVLALRDQLRPAGAEVGSNNWVISKGKSATGAAMVANDPHLGLQYPPLFHLAALTSSKASDNLDLTGGAFPGVPGALVGRGAHVGWGVTVVGYDVTDLYLETLDETSTGCSERQPCVTFKNAPVPTIAVEQQFLVRVGTGAVGVVDSTTLPIPEDRRPPPVVLVVPHHGPVISRAGNSAVSVRWTGHEGNTQDVKAILGLNTAADVDAAIVALKDFATGAQNFVLADDQGNIAYDPHALVPVRKFTETATPIPPWFPLPGDGTAEWGDGVSDCASATLTPVPASCWIADDKLPQGKNPAKGYFFTANSDPTTASHDNNPLPDPPYEAPYLSFDWSDPTGFRATRIEGRIEAAIAAKGSVSLEDMESIQADHVSRPGMAFTPIIAALPSDGGSPELVAAKAMLAQWAANGWACPTGLLGSDPRTSPADTSPKVVENSSACFLFHAFLRTLVTNVFTDDLKVAGQGVNGAAAIKAMLFMLSLDPAAEGTAARTTFCNDADATGNPRVAHTCREQVATALVQAYRSLSARVSARPSDWVWGRVHTIKPVSLLALVTTDYAPGPYARPGGAFTVDVGNPSLSGSGLELGAVSGANVRHISVMDPAKPVVRMQLPGPERDGPAVSLGPDLLGQWVRNSYFDYAHGAEIGAAAVSTQSFKAQ